MDSWWETPLCSGFLRNIVDEIWSGQFVLAFLPKHTPCGFISELKLISELRDIKSFKRINLKLCNLNDPFPIETLLHAHFHLGESDIFVGRRVFDIFNTTEVGISNLIIFENLSVPLLKSFKEFLEEYRLFSIKRVSSHRHKILVILDPNQFKSSDFAGEAGISKIHFEGIFDRLDQTLALRYLTELNLGYITPYIENLIVSLSQFDYTFSETLCGHMNLLENFREICLNHAKTNGWNKVEYIPTNLLSDKDYWLRWAKGIAEKKNGEIFYHSGYLIIHEKILEINKRIWQVGLEILLPMVENMRQKILNCPKFIFPVEFYNEKTKVLIEDKFEFEIGDIFFLWKNFQIRFIGFSRIEKEQLFNFINLCKTIRNDLSHLRIPQTYDITQFYNEYNKVDNILKS